jgi:thiosulfate dehydrogenase [quinone] large subunit
MTSSVLITLLIRLMLGLVFIAWGTDKLQNLPGAYAYLTGAFEKTWIPMFLVYAWAYIMPFLETLMGISFLIGFRYRLTLVVAGFFLAVITFGLVVQGQAQVVSNNLVYLLVVVTGLYFADHNKYAVSHPKA